MLKPILVAILLFFSNTGMTLAGANKPLEASCSLVKALIENGGDGGVSQMVAQVQHWPSDERGKLRALMAPQLRQFTFMAGEVYLIADFDELSQEHLVVIEARGVGTIYFRIVYEKFGDELKLAWITFQSAYNEISKLAFAQVPRKLNCS